MTVEIDGKTLYTLKEFAEEVERSYSYIRKCVRGIDRAKDLREYVVEIENKPLLQESATAEFGDD